MHISLKGRAAAGFSLVEILAVIAVGGILSAIAVPTVTGAIRLYALNSTARNVAAEIRATRYAAVATNRTMVLRFNCPNPGDYRTIEWTGDATIDGDANRCALANYPYPDPDPAARPNADGPLQSLPRGLTFSTAAPISFNATGRVAAQVTIGVTNGTTTRNIQVLATGRVVE